MLARPCRAGFDRFAVYPSHLTRVWWAFFEKVSACSSSIALITYSASALINSLRLIEPSSNLGIVACSGMLSARLSFAAPTFLSNPLCQLFQILRRGTPPLFFKAVSICRAYTNFFDVI